MRRKGVDNGDEKNAKQKFNVGSLVSRAARLLPRGRKEGAIPIDVMRACDASTKMSILLVFGAKTSSAFVKFHTLVWNVGGILSCLGNFFAASERRSGDNKESESNQGRSS